METVLQVESKNMSKMKEILNKDDVVSRASITFREGSMIGKDGYFCLVQGSDEQCKRAVEISKDLAKEADVKDAENLVAKIKEEEESAAAGMGSIFG